MKITVAMCLFMCIMICIHTETTTKVTKMKNLNKLAIINKDYDLETGFFWIEFSNGKSLQCCLKEQRQDEQELYENGPIFLEQIELDNNGHNEGICYDVNKWARDEDGDMEHVHDFLIE